jgi:alpha-tubulin suppressor-like RCC1 family protein
VALCRFGGSAVVSVSCGLRHTLAVAASGQIFSWGYGGEGRLGHGYGDAADRLVPCLISAARFRGARIGMSAAGWEHSVAVTEEGEVYSWGFGGMGRLGVGDSGHRWSPTLVAAGFGRGKRIELVAAGKSHTAAVGKDGALYTWVRSGC